MDNSKRHEEKLKFSHIAIYYLEQSAQQRLYASLPAQMDNLLILYFETANN